MFTKCEKCGEEYNTTEIHECGKCFHCGEFIQHDPVNKVWMHVEGDMLNCNGLITVAVPEANSTRRIIPLTFSEYNRITAVDITAELDSANPWNEPAIGPARTTKRTASIHVHHWFPKEEHESNTDVFGIVQGNYDQFRENCIWLDDYAPINEPAIAKVRHYVYAVWASVEFGTEFPDPICIPGSHNDFHTYYAIAGE